MNSRYKDILYRYLSKTRLKNYLKNIYEKKFSIGDITQEEIDRKVLKDKTLLIGTCRIKRMIKYIENPFVKSKSYK